MKFLFLDDSKQKVKDKAWEYVGYGGYCIDSSNVNKLENDFYCIRKKYHIPRDIELKWSPNKRHYLNREFTGNRNALFEEIMDLCKKYRVRIVCAVYDMNEVFGIIPKKWSMGKKYLWAANEQIKFLIQRFEDPYLRDNDDIGIIIADHYGDKKGEQNLINQSKIYIDQGKRNQQFNRICLSPLTASSKDLPFIQIADLVIGITVGSLAYNQYALKLFEKISRFFLNEPVNKQSTSSASVAESILGYGLKLYPDNFICKAYEVFNKHNYAK
jgi:hypothetical protein